MRRTSLAAAAAALTSAAALAATAEARPTAFGTSTGTPFTTCGSFNDCTVTGQELPATGRLTEVSVGHAERPTGTTPVIKLKLFRVDTSGNFELIRDIGTAKTVEAGTTKTTWSGLAEDVTGGQQLGFFIDNDADQLVVATSSGPRVTFWQGEITTDSTDHSWPPPTVYSAGSPNIGGIVRTPPQATITNGPSAFTQDGSTTFTFTADESPVTWTCQLDGVGVPCSGGAYDATGLSDGPHEFRVRATNDIGQTGPWASHGFTVDRAAPDTSITSGPNGTETSDRRPRFEFSSTEPGSFECSLDSAPWGACSSPSEPAHELADGQHSLAVRAIDRAGNVDGTPAVATFTVKPAAGGGGGNGGGQPGPGGWGIPFTGTSWTFSDPADSTSGPATDIESVRIVYDAAGRFGVLLRFYGSGPRRVWVDLHRSAECIDQHEELWVSTQGTDADIWATAQMRASTFTNGRTSADGRETLVVLEDQRVAGLSFRCLELRSMAGADQVDVLRASLIGKPLGAPILLPLDITFAQVTATLRASLVPVGRALARRSPAQIARRRVHTFTMTAPGPGSVGIEWAVAPSVARRYGVRVRRGAKRVSLAVGARKVTRKGSKVKVKVRLSANGRKVLRRARKIKVQVRSGYLPKGGDSLLEATRSVQLGGRRK